jgi:hypothetical protein
MLTVDALVHLILAIATALGRREWQVKDVISAIILSSDRETCLGPPLP